MPDDDLRQLLAERTRAELPAAAAALLTAVDASAAGDAELAIATLAAYFRAAPNLAAEIARFNAYLSTGVAAGAQLLRTLAPPACDHPGCPTPALVPTAEDGPAERALLLAITEVAGGHHDAAQDAITAHRDTVGATPETVFDLVLALTAILAQLAGGKLDLIEASEYTPPIPGD